MLKCDNPFWKFSLAIYETPGVASECLALQSALNVDLNSLLFCAWLGCAKKIILSEKALAAIDARVRHWREAVVQPLRAVRQQVKSMPEMEHDAVKDLRKEIVSIELQAEKIEQAILFESARDLSDGCTTGTIDDAVRGNVTALLQRKRLGLAPPVADIPAAELLIAAAVTYRA